MPPSHLRQLTQVPKACVLHEEALAPLATVPLLVVEFVQQRRDEGHAGTGGANHLR